MWSSLLYTSGWSVWSSAAKTLPASPPAKGGWNARRGGSERRVSGAAPGEGGRAHTEHPNSELTAFVKQAMMEHGAVNRLLSQHKLRGVCQIDRPYLDAAI